MLAATIERRFEGARCEPRGDGVGIAIEIPLDGVTYRARATMAPAGRVAIEVPNTDGFDLVLAWTDRSSAVRAPTFDDSYLVETNDVTLAGTWLDADARTALIASRYVSSARAPRTTAVLIRDGTWIHELKRDAVTARRVDAEPSADRIADMLVASLALASRPVRWARWFAPLARLLGGQAAARVELGGRPVLRVRRGAADVTVRLVRRLGPDERGRLRTVIGAHRHGSSGDTLTLIADDLPAAAWPPPTTAPHEARASRSNRRHSNLLETASPSASIVRPHDVEITFDGVISDADRLGAAIELAARWATDSSTPGPYR